MNRNRIATLLIAFFLLQQAGVLIASVSHRHAMPGHAIVGSVESATDTALASKHCDGMASKDMSASVQSSQTVDRQSMECCKLSCDCCVGGCQAGIAVPAMVAILPRAHVALTLQIPFAPQAPASSFLRPPITA